MLGLDMTAARDELFTRLDALGIATQTVEHPPLFTVEQSKALRGEIPGAHTKSLFLKCKKDRLWLLVALESTQVNLKTLHQHIGSGRLSFASADMLHKILGVEPGSVTPFAIINDKQNQVCVILDEALLDFERLNFHPLVNTATTGISREGFMRFLDDSGHPATILPVEQQGNAGTDSVRLMH